MDINTLKILLIEDNSADADWIGEILIEEHLTKSKQASPQVDLKHVKRVQSALQLIAQNDFDVILLDLSLPDSQGIDSIAQVKQEAPELPIVVLTALDDESIAIQSVRQGAQDYLVKGRFEGELLIRSIYYAIERQRTEATLRQQAEREKLMKKMSDRIRQSLELKEILNTTVDEVRHFLQADRVVIYRCESDQPGEVIAESITLNFHQAEESIVLNSQNLFHQLSANLEQFNLELAKAQAVQAIDDTITHRQDDIYVLAESQIRAILTLPIWQTQSNQHLQTKADFGTQLRNELEKHSVLTTNSVPVLFGAKQEKIEQFKPSSLLQEPSAVVSRRGSFDQLWGMLVAQNYHHPRQWQNWEIDFLQQLATQVAIAIQQSELYTQLQIANRQLEQLAILDGLTGLANRRYFDRILDNEWHRLIREQKPLSLILCDIDYFKAYNDTYGHPEGDRCLQKVAQILKTAVKRPADLVTRYGGEEFALILPDTNAEGALVVANFILKQVRKLRIPHQASEICNYVTLSIGTATKIPNSHLVVEHLVKMSDDALYQAKKQGRNQIIQYQTCC
ncbi:response regulator receiver modulated diguanylate cyclase [Stanieria cyanosphaera PCC 7437]|uniref:Response regulator receiver modulated diguanylate cyclase n=1 Tax=Stanieria cyanosphaera (strain ATCC 29371 / PCC 7437) TaxID=111780 RepID=K9XZU6_STAC7|nr:diguanylate cyclase [Stanieria cyanosphaera]AFZ37202.1 response regulator receiver modulated diguanylate cyclase [Stanieria cyanosphaera PCC 7437]